MRGSWSDPRIVPDGDAIRGVVQRMLDDDSQRTPSHLYLELLRHGFRHCWDLSNLDLSAVTDLLRQAEIEIDRRSARLATA
ncbi:MAG: hypothetical protein M5U14_16630 [Acidimicrobiia bacterium]|nr:hypothetical protein [Acidimicrobiia bacterium]